jgi:ribosomal protein S18 acetylase RimI-like enzyme
MTDRKCLIRVSTEADLRAVAQIHVASWQDAYKGIVPDELLADRSVEGSLSGWRWTFAKYPANITVATSQDGVIQGFCCAGPVVDVVKNASFEFEIYALHVSPNSRQQGIGATLLRDAFARATDREEMHSAIVWTLKDLRLSRRFYEREGGKVVKSGVGSIGEFALPEVAYGWTSLRGVERVD